MPHGLTRFKHPDLFGAIRRNSCNFRFPQNPLSAEGVCGTGVMNAFEKIQFFGLKSGYFFHISIGWLSCCSIIV
jgi:hypothetical protein